MPADLAAGYCGEASVEAFRKRVGKEYPDPAFKEGRREFWFKKDLDQAIGLHSEERELLDAAEVL